jgi:hypothetical protein
MIAFDQIERVYNGRSGCMCGCKGSYSYPAEKPIRAKRMLKKMLNDPSAEYCEVSNSIYVDDGVRNSVLYLNEGVKIPERFIPKKDA